MDASQQGQLVESLRVTNPELATGLNREIMPFSSLSMLDDETIRTLVNYLDVNTIAVAIHNLPQEIQDRFLNVMEGGMATEIEAKMDSLGFAETQIASTAQQSILDLVCRLAAKGILQIHQSSGIPDV
jgi:flagellar motor switch protein FliG